MRTISNLLIPILIVASTGGQLPSKSRDQRNLVSSSELAVEGNVPIVTLEFKRNDGTRRRARFIFDSGGGALVLNRSLVNDLGLRVNGDPLTDDDGKQYFPIQLKRAWLGDVAFDLESVRAFTPATNRPFDVRDSVEGLLPGHVFRDYQVVIDYPRKLMIVGRSGTVPHRGQPTKSPYLADIVHPRLEASIDGKTYGFLLDTGAKVSMIRNDLLDSWIARHPSWRSSSAAVGPANMTGSDNEVTSLLVRIPEIDWSGFTLNDVVAVSRNSSIFEESSKEMTGPIVGAIAGNILSSFRIEIDYPEQMVYLEKSGDPDPRDFDTVGLVLEVDSSGALIIKGVSPQASEITRASVRPGDILIEVKGHNSFRRTLTGAAQALSGNPGDEKLLVLQRDGARRVAKVTVAHIL